jgi:hypothetical protein
VFRRGGIMGFLSSGVRILRSYRDRRKKHGDEETPESRSVGQPSLAPKT